MSPQIIPLKSRTDFLEKFQPQRPFAFELKTGSQSYIPPDPKDDKALHTALDPIRGIQENSAYPLNPKTAVPN
jgi:hypothetical protein